jgi:hypothetical protein
MLARPFGFPLAGALLAGVLSATPAALAAAPAAPPPPPPSPELEEDPQPPLIPDAPDKLGGHLVIGAAAAVAGQFGEMKSGTNATTLGPGMTLDLDIGLGLGRSVTFGVFGELARYPAKRCIDCSASSYAVGPFLRYHLVQGARFDPWMTVGVAYKYYSAEGPLIVGSTELPPIERTFRGVEWGHLALGADFYVFKNFAFGPFIELTGGSVLHEALPIEIENASLLDSSWTHYGGLSAGLRLVFDTPGK